MNTKNKHYKEYLVLAEKYWNAPFNSKEFGETSRRLDNPIFRQFDWYVRGCPKKFRKLYTRSDRAHNKRALKKNLNMIGCEYAEHPMDNDVDWFGFEGGWEDEYTEYRYNHRHSANWFSW